ncbi:MauE/DoxX family redox-associated membrane protein [Micromonospora sp. CPCC 205539]|uniref:MauE/DoxX family redox-associated membrane protein n=1 Tax=Micromonospora sp. CPCC 205539 TaxID=3122408 RepID=UPI002FEF8F49
MTYLQIGSWAVLLGVFVVALAGKIRKRAAFDEFRASIAALRVLPRRWSLPVAVAVAATEATVVVLLALPITALVGVSLAVALLAAFTTGIVLALRQGQRAPCRCFGASATPLGPTHVVRNLVLMAVGSAGLLAAFVSEATTAARPHPAGVAVTLATAAVAVLLVVRLDDLTALFTSHAPTR